MAATSAIHNCRTLGAGGLHFSFFSTWPAGFLICAAELPHTELLDTQLQKMISAARHSLLFIKNIEVFFISVKIINQTFQ